MTDIFSKAAHNLFCAYADSTGNFCTVRNICVTQDASSSLYQLELVLRLDKIVEKPDGPRGYVFIEHGGIPNAGTVMMDGRKYEELKTRTNR